MACTPTYCSYHNTGTTTCSGHRTACSTNRTLAWTWDGDLDTEVATSTNINDLRSKIREEVSTYNVHVWYNIGLTEESSYTSSTLMSNEQYNNLDNMVGGMVGTYFQDKNDFDIITDVEWDDLITRYNTARQNCICNTDCSCNNICACYGDCGCHY